MAPTFSVKVNGEWVPISTLPEQEQDEIKQRVATRIGMGIKQQIASMAAGRVEYGLRGHKGGNQLE